MKEMIDVAFLKKCVDCGKDFFTEREKNFYKARRLILPQRCKECREKRKLKIYQEIDQGWNIDAKQENSKYFYNVEEVNMLAEGRKSFVIGRKGSGKTAIAQHLRLLQSKEVFAESLTFTNFPFNVLYKLSNEVDYTHPNQYVSVWKYIICYYICKNILSTNNIPNNIEKFLKSIYPDIQNNSLERILKETTIKNIGVSICGFGFDLGFEKDKSTFTWLELSEILEKIIINYCKNEKYFIIFDELDEDYRNFESKEAEYNYKCMLTSLFKAVQDIKSNITKLGIKVYPIIFLRSDIYERIDYSDKNKWSESIIDLKWDSSQIKKMLAYRISVAMNNPNMNFDKAWNRLFSRDKVRMGNMKSREMEIFEYIERSTEMRPRDFVKYIKESVRIAMENNVYPITPQIVKDADSNFSEYLKSETGDELHAMLPEYRKILDLLSSIRKQFFKFDEFEREYKSLVERKEIPSGDVREILRLLFEAGVIGNRPKIKNQTIFSFDKKSARFNYNETMVIHRGLYKALNIF